MRVNILLYQREMQTSCKAHPEYKGYLELDEFNPDVCFDLCNWGEYQEEKPDNLFADVPFCGSSICFENTETNEYWLALSVGWKHGTKEEIEKYVMENYNSLFWVEN